MEFNEDNKYTDEFFEQYMNNYMRREKPSADVNNDIQRKPTGKRRMNNKKFWSRLIIFVLIIAIIVCVVAKCSSDNDKTVGSREHPIFAVKPGEKISYDFHSDKDTVKLTTQIDSEYGILIDLTDNRIVAEKQSDEVIYPASLTKILTLLVAVENIEDLSSTFEMTSEIVDPAYRDQASMAGFMAGEIITAKDLLYGMILPSGAEAAQGVAVLTAGSEEKFVEMMNKKVAELGITTAHFSNTSGLHNKDNYCTVKDMAIILDAAIHNEVCYQVLSTFEYTTSASNKHPEGILLTSTMFSRMTGEEPGTAKILAGKTGYVNEAGNCLATYGISESGKEYIFVTTKAHGIWKSVWDHINTYRDFTEKLPSNNGENSQ